MEKKGYKDCSKKVNGEKMRSNYYNFTRNPILILLIFLSGFNTALSLDTFTWTPAGPGGGGGMFVPAVSHLSPDLMFISCDMGGVYRSTNNGSTFQMLDFRQLSNSRLLAPVFHPTDANTIWDENGNTLKQSTDGGITWKAVWNIPGTPEAMICLRSSPLTLFVAGSQMGMFKSTDGTAFSQVNSLTGVSFLAENGSIVLAASSHNIWVSSDGGNSFTSEILPEKFGANIPITDIALGEKFLYILQAGTLWRKATDDTVWFEAIHTAEFNRGNFRFVRAEARTVWVTTLGGNYQETALYSNDEGKSFKPVFFCNGSNNDTSNFAGDWNTLDFNCGWGGPALGFNISRLNPEMAIWTDAGRALTTSDGGKSWSPLYTQFADNGKRQRGKRWQSVGLEVTSNWDLFISPWEKDFIHAAYTDIGGAYSTDGGKSWRNTFDAGVPGEWFNTTYNIAVDTANQKIWGAFSGLHDIPGGWISNSWDRANLSYCKGGICRSTNGGRNWTPVQNGGLPNKPVTLIAIDFSSPVNSRRMYAAVWSDGIWRTTDGGNNWERKSNGLDCGDGTSTTDGPNNHISEVQVHPGGAVFALKTKYIRNGSIIKNDGGLWFSSDFGENWKFISANVPECLPNTSIDLNGEHSWADPVSFCLGQNFTGHIYVGAQNCNNGKVQGGLYETMDTGKTWKRIYQTYCAFRLTKSKFNNHKFYLATSGEGIFIANANNKILTFNQVDNFPFANATRITEDPNDSNIIWVNTFGGGIWKGEINRNGKIVDEENHIIDNIEVFPNPAQDFVNFSYNPDLSSNIELKIFNSLGETISILIENSFQKFGLHQIKYETGNLPTGIYFYTFRMKNELKTGKFLVIR